VGRIPTVSERGEAPSPAPPAESELSAIIKRLRESGTIEKESAPAGAKEAEIPPKAKLPETGEGARAAEQAVSAGERTRPPVEERIPAKPGAPPIQGIGVPGDQGPEERVRVDLGKMMKRIKRLDITSIRRELQEGAEGGEAAAAPAAAPSEPAGEPVPPSGIPVRASPPAAETKGKSDIDELKAFIQRLEVLEEPGEAPPPEKRVLARLGLKPPAEEVMVPPVRREIMPPVPEKERILEELPGAGEAGPVQKPPEERVAPRPSEPDTKAKIASLLRRSGLVKPPAEEPPAEPVTGIPVGPGVSEGKEEAPATAPVEEVEITIPKPQRKKVEITRVPRRPEKPLREPPHIDERMIQKILKQPGVIAVSTFFEGFAVQSAGRADFEQVAANAEDLFRAGKKIAREIDIGPLNQIILETGKGKLIIAPHGDLNVCIFTEPDANLGLIRVAIKSMQVEKG
jgi:predicted regulator of Ras-like GTPase activity (Roadblock/LC7/MglB family)